MAAYYANTKITPKKITFKSDVTNVLTSAEDRTRRTRVGEGYHKVVFV